MSRYSWCNENIAYYFITLEMVSFADMVHCYMKIVIKQRGISSTTLGVYINSR